MAKEPRQRIGPNAGSTNLVPEEIHTLEDCALKMVLLKNTLRLHLAGIELLEALPCFIKLEHGSLFSYVCEISRKKKRLLFLNLNEFNSSQNRRESAKCSSGPTLP